MEIQLTELIEQIRKNGVEAAEEKSSEILEAARAEAAKIVADAKAEAAKILSDAKAENDRIVRVSEEAIRQAGRNVLLTFRESVTRELAAVTGEEVKAAYSEERLCELILSVAKGWTEAPDAEDITILLSPDDLAELETSLLAAFKEHLIGGVTLKASDGFDGGFRIAVDGGRVYYDYSAESVGELISSYLSPKVAALMREAAK